MHLTHHLLPLAFIVNSKCIFAAPASGTTQNNLDSTTVTSGNTSASYTPGSCTQWGTAQTLSVSPSRPSNAVQVPGNFVGFGFETAFLNDYANTFSENLVNSVAQRLGEPVIIRIGGTSGDRLIVDPYQPEIKTCVAGDCPVGSSATYVLGPAYFQGFLSFPNQQFTFQAPLGQTLNVTNSVDYVTRAYAATGADRVNAIAIGNEPDTYDHSDGAYTPADYTDAALELEQAIVSALGLSINDLIFEVLDTASGDASSNFTVEEALEDGLDQNQNAKYVAQHYYQSPTNLPTYGPAELQYYLMNHSAITSRYQEGYIQALEYVEANYPSASYIISEGGSSLIGPPLSYQDAFGACLWAVDFSLYSMSLGVKRVDGSGRPAAPHSLWVPDTSTNSPSLGQEQNIGPQVRGPYYSRPMIADFLGQDSGAVVNILGEDTLTAYALYDSSTGGLSKVALVNLNYWSADTGGTRYNVTFEVPVPSGTSSVTVGRLQADAGANALGYDAQGYDGLITWEGETWSYQLDLGAGNLVAGVPQTETVAVCNGIAYVVVPDTSAAVVYIS